MPSRCCPISYTIVALMLLGDAILDFSCAAVWSTGLAKHALSILMNETEWLNVSRTPEFIYNFTTLSVSASILYSLTGISSVIATIGVMSGFYELQVHHFMVSVIRSVGTIIICECVSTLHYTETIYSTTRILLYVCTVLNIVLLFCNYASLAMEYERCVKEDNGELQPEVRPLSHFFSRCLGSPRRRFLLARRRPSSSEDALESAALDAVDSSTSSSEKTKKSRTASQSVAVNIEEPALEPEDLKSGIRVSTSQESLVGEPDDEVDKASSSPTSTRRDGEDSQSQKSQESQPEAYFKHHEADEPREP